ncbi:MAG TPA: amidohydrolase family protein [Anaerolineales bacterium]|nr:amidohydrolase family protein [Anaerolineales bacterium]
MAKVDWILHNATVVTMDEGYRVLRDGAVAVEGDSISAVGPAKEILATYTAHELIDCRGSDLIPGLVNAHTHAPMTLLRGMADDLRLEVWLLGYMMPVEREFVSPDFCRLGTLLACAEMIRSGITCFADMYYFEDAVAQATAEAGMRAVCSQTVLKFPTPDAASYEDSLASAREFITRWKGHPLIVPSVAPHAPYTCTPEILQACASLAVEFDVPLHTHIAETREEVDEWREKYDMPVVPWVKKQGLLEAKVLAAHCVHLDDGEIHTLQHAGAGVAHNPSSNLKLASGFAPVVDMLEAGLSVGIGTDGPASNNDLDMFEEMRLATFIAKGVSGDPTALPARLTLAMATRLGAQALHLGHLTGSIEPGKRADLVLVGLRGIHNLPQFNRDPQSVYSRLVYAGKASDVTDVMVNGRWLLREGSLQTIDVEPLIQAAAEYAARIDAFLIQREGSILTKLVAIEGAEREESYEVQIKVRIEDSEAIVARLASGAVEVIRRAHYQEYDTYFLFDDPAQGRLRYREDEFVSDGGEVFNVRYRLTLTGPAREYQHPVPLSRSRFIAPATHSLRFYREYFKPARENEIDKDRRRWLVRFRGKEFFVNLDRMTKPALEQSFLEIKSRTWSRGDAEEKSALILELLKVLGAENSEVIPDEYPDLAEGSRAAG